MDLSILAGLGFSQARQVQGRASIADLFKPSQRCGIYVLHFSNGDLYAGQAVDVTRRYAQHRVKYKDIEKISFRQVPSVHLNDEERTVIWTLEQEGQVLRNNTFASIPKGESDFDLVMPPEEQARWLEDLSYVDNEGDRLINPALRRRYHDRFQSLLDMPYANVALDVLKTYARVGIPAGRRGEVSFWACSCLPKRNTYSRINIYWQETLTAFTHKNELWFSLHVADSPFVRMTDQALKRLFERHPAAVAVDHQYNPGGPDQVSLEIPAEAAEAFIKEPEVLSAIRLFNLRLMQKGPCTYGRYHCMDLADILLFD